MLNAQWLPTTNGKIPDGAFVAGMVQEKKMFITRTTINGEISVGGIVAGSNQAMIPWGGKENHVSDFEVLTLTPENITPGIYTIKTKLADKCLDVQWANKAQGTLIHLWSANNGEAQRFNIVRSNEAGYYHIKTEWGLCLGVGGSNPNPGAQVVTWECINNLDDQKWKFISTGDGHYNLQSKLGTYIDVSYAKTHDGADIKMNGYSTWNGNIAQRWKLVKAGGAEAMGTETTVNLRDIVEQRCPKQMYGGDREFDGHGPRINCRAQLSIGDGGRALYANVSIVAKETTHDWSETRGSWNFKVYDAPSGKQITKIASDNFSETEFTSGAAGFQLLFPGSDVSAVLNQIFNAAQSALVKEILKKYNIDINDAVQVGRFIAAFVNNGNTCYKVPPVRGTAVKTFEIVGDTGGSDISDDDNCNDDTRIVKITFNAARVFLR